MLQLALELMWMPGVVMIEERDVVAGYGASS